MVYVFVACVVEEEGDDDVAGDREGSACAYDCGWSPVKRERNVDFPEPVMEGFGWVWWGSAVVGGTMEDQHHGGCSSVQGRSWWRRIGGWMDRRNERKGGEGRSVL